MVQHDVLIGPGRDQRRSADRAPALLANSLGSDYRTASGLLDALLAANRAQLPRCFRT
jgi:hypothetical protein